MSKIGLIITREYTTRVRKKTFIIMTILGPLLMGGFLWGAVWLGKQEDTVTKVLVADETGLLGDRMTSSGSVKFKVEKKYMTIEDFKKGPYQEYNLFLQIFKNAPTTKTAKLFFRKNPSITTQSYISTQMNNAFELYRVEQANIDVQLYAQIKSSYIPIDLVDIEDTKNKKSQYAGVLGFMFSLLIYLFIFLYGAQVMRGVIEEKTSRVVEVIVSSVSTFQLMMGKIIGIALVGLTQFLIWVGMMFVIFSFMKNSLFDQYANVAGQNVGNNDLFDFIFHQVNYPGLIAIFIFYFLAGYLLYASLFAAVGSAVDSETDTQQFMLPVSVPLIFAYVISVMGIENPEGSAQVWSSFIPFTSPVSMMVRVVTGTVPGWHVAISMALLVVTFIFTTWVAAKIYRTGILMYGKKASYKEMLKWMRYKG